MQNNEINEGHLVTFSFAPITSIILEIILSSSIKYRSVRFRDHLRSVKQPVFEKILRSTTFIYNKLSMHFVLSDVLSCYIILAVAADQLLMSTTTPGTAPFCTRVLALSYLKFEFMILHQLIVNLFEKKGWSSWGEETNFCP